MNRLVNVKMESIGVARKGHIVSIVSNGKVDNKCFEVVGEEKGQALLSRVKKEKGFPNAGHKTVYKTDLDLVLVDKGSGRNQREVNIAQPDSRTSEERIDLLKKIYFEGPFNKCVTLTDKFQKLVSALSPENLYCDGEISHSQAQRKYRELKTLWSDCERELGRKVSESEVWKTVEKKTELRREV